MHTRDPDALIRASFAHDEAAPLWANHAAIGPWPLPVAHAISDFAQENAVAGPRGYAAWLQRETRLRERAARLLNAPSADDIALLPNTCAGVNLVANGIAWQAGDNVVGCVDEFPSNQLPWSLLAARGVEYRRADIRAAADPELALLSLVDARTRVLAVSSVQWQDGFRLDLPRLGAGCAGGPLFFVDAIQEFGALPVDVQAARVDVLAAGAHKWQLGPEGMALFFCGVSARARLAPSQPGWRMLERPYRFDDGEPAVARGARRFESGSPNMVGQAGLEAALELVESVGTAEIARRVEDNTARLMAACEALPGLELASRAEPLRRSGIVAVRGRARSARELQQRLERRGVLAVVRAGGLRLSPHYYQHGAPMDRLLNALEDAAGP